MSVLEVDLKPESLQRLQEKAKQQGLPVSEFARTALETLAASPDTIPQPLHSIMELEGLGAEIWKDDQGNLIDAQQYVNELRQEWDHRP